MPWSSITVPAIRSSVLTRHDFSYPDCDIREVGCAQELQLDKILSSAGGRLGTVDLSGSKGAMRILKKILAKPDVTSFEGFPEE